MKCKRCNKRFKLKKEDRYEVNKDSGIAGVFSQINQVYECFDCPRCGCQNIVGIREKKVDDD